MEKKRRITGVLGLVVTLLLLFVLLFFTKYGDRVYEKITPKVSVAKTTQTYQNDYIVIEPEYLTEDGAVYLTYAESGFSRTIFRIKKQPVEVCGIAEEFGKPMIPYKSVMGYNIVKNPSAVKGLKDGDKVLIR